MKKLFAPVVEKKETQGNITPLPPLFTLQQVSYTSVNNAY
ncbi:hypothetical protein MUS_1969 [Bacillus velezensis YAU B9601-Y2]|uniref:Uncharacterized protein n=1 Tax=Bacillus amyloliquefaciens (strain Y2) TaxID=1155777 RepID=I2C5L4_BACAY|nr:hypothetical protein MUS_1969 [Bacillus velezensis YAU B9601-Y2]